MWMRVLRRRRALRTRPWLCRMASAQPCIPRASPFPIIPPHPARTKLDQQGIFQGVADCLGVSWIVGKLMIIVRYPQPNAHCWYRLVDFFYFSFCGGRVERCSCPQRGLVLVIFIHAQMYIYIYIFKYYATYAHIQYTYKNSIHVYFVDFVLYTHRYYTHAFLYLHSIYIYIYIYMYCMLPIVCIHRTDPKAYDAQQTYINATSANIHSSSQSKWLFCLPHPGFAP